MTRHRISLSNGQATVVFCVFVLYPDNICKPRICSNTWTVSMSHRRTRKKVDKLLITLYALRVAGNVQHDPNGEMTGHQHTARQQNGCNEL